MEIDVSSPDGNSFVIMGYVICLLRDAGRGKEILGVLKRMQSGDYENVKKVAEEVTYGSITFYDSIED